MRIANNLENALRGDARFLLRRRVPPSRNSLWAHPEGGAPIIGLRIKLPGSRPISKRKTMAVDNPSHYKTIFLICKVKREFLPQRNAADFESAAFSFWSREAHNALKTRLRDMLSSEENPHRLTTYQGCQGSIPLFRHSEEKGTPRSFATGLSDSLRC
ncbi:MAG: hypothetical protein ACOYIR_05180 [Christensenellales bacterium]